MDIKNNFISNKSLHIANINKALEFKKSKNYYKLHNKSVSSKINIKDIYSNESLDYETIKNKKIKLNNKLNNAKVKLKSLPDEVEITKKRFENKELELRKQIHLNTERMYNRDIHLIKDQITGLSKGILDNINKLYLNNKQILKQRKKDINKRNTIYLKELNENYENTLLKVSKDNEVYKVFYNKVIDSNNDIKNAYFKIKQKCDLFKEAQELIKKKIESELIVKNQKYFIIINRLNYLLKVVCIYIDNKNTKINKLTKINEYSPDDKFNNNSNSESFSKASNQSSYIDNEHNITNSKCKLYINKVKINKDNNLINCNNINKLDNIDNFINNKIKQKRLNNILFSLSNMLNYEAKNNVKIKAIIDMFNKTSLTNRMHNIVLQYINKLKEEYASNNIIHENTHLKLNNQLFINKHERKILIDNIVNNSEVKNMYNSKKLPDIIY